MPFRPAHRSPHLVAVADSRWRVLAQRTTALAALGASLLASVHPAAAATQTWLATPPDNTFTGNNWSTIVVVLPVTGTISAGDNLVFNTSSVTSLNENEVAGFNIGGFNFNSGASAFTIAGNAFTLSGGIANNSTNLQTINDAITLNGAQTFTTTAGGGNLALGGTLTAASGFTVTGAGTLNLTGTGNTAQQITINTGATLNLGTNGITLNVASGGGTINGGTGGTINATGGGTIRLNGGSPTNGGDFGVASGSGTLQINAVIANGTQNNLDVYGNSTTGTVTFAAANTYSGATNVQRGTLRLANSLALQNSTLVMAGFNAPGTTALVFDAAVTANAFTLGGLSSTDTSTDRNIVLQNNASTPAAVALTVGNNGTNQTYAGVLSGAGSLTKIGAGTQTLSGANTYTGATTVNAGTLLINGNQSTATGAVTVNNSGTLLGGTGVLGGAVNVGSSARITGGTAGSGNTIAAGNVGTLGTGALTLTLTSIFLADIAGASSYDLLNVTGSVNVTGATLALNIPTGLTITNGTRLTLIANDGADAITGNFASLAQGATISANGYMFTADYRGGTGNDFDLVAVPEPGTVAAGLLVLGTLGYHLRRRCHRFLPAKRETVVAA